MPLRKVSKKYQRKPGAFDRFTCAQTNEQGSRINKQDPINPAKTRITKFDYFKAESDLVAEGILVYTDTLHESINSNSISIENLKEFK
jgi:hypothetical protein